MKSLLPLAALLLTSMTGLRAAETTKPLKVFILAGQSNMEGHAKVETFDYIGDDPATAPLLQQMRDADGKARVCDHVWISYFTGNGETNGEGFGKLTAGYGSRQNPAENGGKIGPEFTFGLTMDQALSEPALIIKTAWGGKSLFYDFRPPSAGPYVRTPADLEKNRYPEAQSGQYYRLMIEHVKRVLGDIRRVCPAYDEKQGFEIAGFVWLQGWNDMVNRDVYPIPPKDSKEPRYVNYSLWLSDFIRDTRQDLKAPNMPFVIGVMGVEGKKPNQDIAAFREAMAAPAALPEFKGNVVAVPTAPFWDEALGSIQAKHDQVRQMSYLLKTKNKNQANADGSMTDDQQREYVKQFEAKLISPQEAALWKRGASNAGYHYLGCAKTFALMGKAFADALLELKPREASAAGEREGEATVLHRADVMRDRSNGKHLWPVIHTPEARVSYFEVTGRGTLHYHPDADHRLYVLEGAVLVTCGATITKCTAGDFIVIPRGVRHCYDVPAPGEKALLLTFDAPPYDPKKTVNLDQAAAGK